MEVVKEKRVEDWHSLKECRGCKSELVVSSEDILYRMELYRDEDYNFYYFICPLCKYDNYFTEFGVPDLVWDKAKEKFFAKNPKPKKPKPAPVPRPPSPMW